MSKMKIEVEVSKETYELGDALAGIVESVKAKSADGINAAEIAASLTENVGKIMTGIAGIEQIGTEAKEDPAVEIMTGSIIGGKIAGALLKKQAA